MSDGDFSASDESDDDYELDSRPKKKKKTTRAPPKKKRRVQDRVQNILYISKLMKLTVKARKMKTWKLNWMVS